MEFVPIDEEENANIRTESSHHTNKDRDQLRNSGASVLEQNSSVEKKDLRDVNLSYSNLEKSNLKEANLRNIVLCCCSRRM